MRRAIGILLMVALLAACGFQLRGDARLPGFMERTHIAVADESTVFVRELRLLLEANGIEIVDEPSPRAATLRIDSQNIRRQALSVSGQARVREFLIVFEVSWRLEDADGEEALERTTLRLTRDYSFDEGEILAAQREEEFLRDDLGRAMADQMIRRLEAFRAPVDGAQP
ncbi:LPS-assembly lipoprotein LptE [Wenzhouxiangella sp. EGI_FJ10409]|uniref:LPS-assembly lipoprotein LptE n=1 Tax=Wenzhouxiangella sp. EGI_FJ10409 TaxID=3243767 RepID=UPI0035DD3E34